MEQAGKKSTSGTQAKEDQRSPSQVNGVEHIPRENGTRQSRQEGMGAYYGGQVKSEIRSICIPITGHVSNSGSATIRASIRPNGEEKIREIRA